MAGIDTSPDQAFLNTEIPTGDDRVPGGRWMAGFPYRSAHTHLPPGPDEDTLPAIPVHLPFEGSLMAHPWKTFCSGRTPVPFCDMEEIPPLSVAVLLGALVLFLGACGNGEDGAGGRATRGLAGEPLELVLTPQASGTTALLQAVSPVSTDVVWVSGHDATYARTQDGGESWEAAVMAGEEGLQFRDVEAFDENTAYLMSAGTGDLSRIYRTDDGGKTWDHQYTASHPEAFLDCMAFWDEERGLVYGDAVDGVPFLLQTENGGESWSRVPREVLPPSQEGEGGFAASGTCVTTGEGGKAWIAMGNAEKARVLWTMDWGRSWEVVDMPVTGGSGAGLTTVQMEPEGRRGLALGGVIGGDTLRTVNVAATTDGGLSWMAMEAPVMLGPVYGSALAMTETRTVAVAVGPGGLDWSRDLGRSWASADTTTYWAVAFAGPSAGWAVGPGGRIVKLALR